MDHDQKKKWWQSDSDAYVIFAKIIHYYADKKETPWQVVIMAQDPFLVWC